MDRLRKLINQITAQLSVLTGSQRLAVALSAALVVVSMLWLMQWSVTPDLIPLVNYEFSYDELDAAEQAIEATGKPYQTRGRRIYVRSVDQPNLIRVLHKAEVLPEGSLYDMTSVVTSDNPFESPEARKFKQNYAKGNELAKIIATAPFVKNAAVLINEKTKRRLGGQSDVPTASVNLVLAPGTEVNQEMIRGFARLVAGAVAGLKPWNVYITDSTTGRSYNVPHPEDAGNFNFLSQVKEQEAHFQSKILDKLAHIPGLTAAVTVDLDPSRTVEQKQTFSAPEPKTESTRISEQSSGRTPSEAGVQANLGQAVTAGPQGGAESSQESDVENFPPQITSSKTIERNTYELIRTTATVGIPRSFVVGVYRAQYPDGEPNPRDTDEDFKVVLDDQVQSVKKSVEQIVMARPGDVEVDVYPDVHWQPGGSEWASSPGGVAAAGQASSQDVMDLALSWAPQAGLGLLALMSLFMMMRVVRKSADEMGERKRRMESEEETILSADSPAVGQAAASTGFLVGRELGEDALRSRELNEEVARLVEEDPDGTAELLRRWMEEPA